MHQRLKKRNDNRTTVNVTKVGGISETLSLVKMQCGNKVTGTVRIMDTSKHFHHHLNHITQTEFGNQESFPPQFAPCELFLFMKTPDLMLLTRTKSYCRNFDKKYGNIARIVLASHCTITMSMDT